MQRGKLIVGAVVIVAIAAFLSFTPPGKRVLVSLGLTAACTGDECVANNRPK